MSGKDLHGKPFDQATITKLEVFETYLESWLPTFIQSPYFSEVNICDFFAGQGKDLLGVAGSSQRILKVIKKFESSIFKKQLKINIILNDYSRKKYIDMKNCFEEGLKECEKILGLVNVSYCNEDFQVLFKEKKDSIKKGPNLIFVDQNGIKHTTKEIFLDIESFEATDFLFFFSSSYLIRFSEEFKPLFPDLDFDALAKGKSRDVHRKVLDYYKSLLPEESKTKLYPFTIKKGRNTYGLVFGSKHVLGVEKFLNVSWEKNATNGEADFDIDEDSSAKQMVLFGNQKLTKIEKFQQDLESFIKDRKVVTNKDVFEFTIENGHVKKHAIDLLKKMRDKKEIESFKYPRIGYDQIYKRKEIVSFKVI